jgi:acyl carrier protein
VKIIIYVLSRSPAPCYPWNVPKSSDREPFRRDILEFLERNRGIDPARVTDESRLAEDLGLDSLALVEMGFLLLTRHGLILNDDHILTMRTIGDVLDMLGDAYARLPHGPR